jgi:hypothetical protein
VCTHVLSCMCTCTVCIHVLGISALSVCARLYSWALTTYVSTFVHLCVHVYSCTHADVHVFLFACTGVCLASSEAGLAPFQELTGETLKPFLTMARPGLARNP